MLLCGRSHRVLAFRRRHEAAGPQRGLHGAVALRRRAKAAATDGARTEPGHTPRPGGERQVQPPTPPARDGLSGRQGGLVRALQRGIILLDTNNKAFI